jgi:hypothetical protein
VRSALRFRSSDDLRGSGVTGRWPFPFPPRPCLLPGGPSRSSARSATLGSTRASCPLASGSSPELLSRADRLSPVSSRGIRRDERSRDRPPYRPFIDMASTRPLPPDVAIGLRIRAASSGSCSVLVVSHHLDGFLRVETCGLVASRYRSWSSPRFLRSIATCCRSCRGRASRSPRCVHPSKNSRDRSCSASPRPLPPRRSAPFGAVDLEVLFHDRVCDVASALQMTRILSFLGFCPLQGPRGAVSSRSVSIRRWVGGEERSLRWFIGGRGRTMPVDAFGVCAAFEFANGRRSFGARGPVA